MKNKLQAKMKNLSITILPDFYLDVIIDPNMSYMELIGEIDKTYKRGGGNILGPTINFIPGGNGGNVAYVLAKLGVPTNFISETSPLGGVLIEHFMQSIGVETNITTTGKMAASLIFEILKGKLGKSNVMLSNGGSILDFSSSKLNKIQWNVLKNSTAIGITNAQNLRMEELVETILTNILRSITVSIDFSDLTPHVNRIENIKKRILDHPTNSPTIIVGNENELPILAQKPNLDSEEAINILSSEFPDILFGLHEAKKSQIWKNGKQLACVPCFKISVVYSTGAGDAWHAGFLFGHQSGLNPSELTKFANAVAALYISQKESLNLFNVLNLIDTFPQYDL